MSKHFQTPQLVLYICTGSKCKKRGGKDIGRLLRSRIKSAGRQDTVEIIYTECTDRCKFAPVLCLQPQNRWLHEATEHQALLLFDQYVLPQPKTTPNAILPDFGTTGNP